MRCRRRGKWSAYEPADSATPPYKPLSMLYEGEEGRMASIDGGRGLEVKLAELGFLLGTEIKVLYNNGSGPLMILLKDSKMGVGRGIAKKVFIKVEEC